MKAVNQGQAGMRAEPSFRGLPRGYPSCSPCRSPPSVGSHRRHGWPEPLGGTADHPTNMGPLPNIRASLGHSTVDAYARTDARPSQTARDSPAGCLAAPADRIPHGKPASAGSPTLRVHSRPSGGPGLPSHSPAGCLARAQAWARPAWPRPGRGHAQGGMATDPQGGVCQSQPFGLPGDDVARSGFPSLRSGRGV